MDETNTPAAPPAEGPDAALHAALAEAEHYKRIVAAFVRRFGPLHFFPGEYHLTDPDDLLLLGVDEDSIAAGHLPTFALRDQVRQDGQIVHRLTSTAVVIGSADIDGAAAIEAARRIHHAFQMATDASPAYTLPEQREGSDG